MYTYLSKDSTLMVADKTLIMYSGSAAHVDIPRESEPGHLICAIGDCAFNGCSSLQAVTIPSGVTSIGNSAFCGCSSLCAVTIPPTVTSIGLGAFLRCSSLRAVTIPSSVTSIGKSTFSGCDLSVDSINLSFTEDEFGSIQHNSRRSIGGEQVIPQPQSVAVLKELANCFQKPILATIPDHIDLLFCDQQDPAKAAIRSVYASYSTQNSICFEPNYGELTEDQAFQRLLINRSRFSSENAAAETKNDWYLRAEKIPPFPKTCCITFREEDILQKNGRAIVHCRFRDGWWYWQSAKHIRLNGEDYWLYSRNYLTGDEKIPYYKLDMAIYDKTGLVTDRKLSEEIYAKYKLAAIL